MLKMIKHEFRKNRTGLLVMAGVAAALFLLAPLGELLDSEPMMVLSVTLLMLYTYAAFIFVLVRGVTAYSGELHGRTGYLMLMVPRSALCIIASKLLFTLCFALVMMALCAAAFAGSGMIFMSRFYQLRGALNMLDYLLADTGLQIADFVRTGALLVLETMIYLLSLVSISYLAVTLSASVLRRGKGSKLVSGLLFVLLCVGVIKLSSALMPELFSQSYASPVRMVSALLPMFLVHLALSVLFAGLSALLLKRKVCL